jgi:hypothetical protein
MAQLLEPQAPQWTENEAIRYESACACLYHLMSHCSSAIQEIAREDPHYQQHIRELAKLRARLLAMRRTLRVNNFNEIDIVLNSFGAVLRNNGNTQDILNKIAKSFL